MISFEEGLLYLHHVHLREEEEEEEEGREEEGGAGREE